MLPIYKRKLSILKVAIADLLEICSEKAPCGDHDISRLDHPNYKNQIGFFKVKNHLVINRKNK